ncbi:hypothetical protein [Deinococcus sp.]|uniref:hypothetical protein n=1 Tax=Deinococcus sp. TaxID=47478 RepID=UPI003C7E7597
MTGQRTVSVTERRGNAEFTAQIQALELRYPAATRIRLVLTSSPPIRLLPSTSTCPRRRRGD